MKLDWKLLIATTVAGIVTFVLGQMLYGALVDSVSRPLLIALLMAMTALVLAAVICATVMITGDTEDEFLFLESRGMIILGLAVCLAVLFGLSMLFEWIYDHEEIKDAGGTSYIFVLDESGSMTSNDPNFERYVAVDTVVSTLEPDVPYAVYMFSESCVRIREMAPASAGPAVRPADADMTMMGQTYISDALTQVYNDIESGSLSAGKDPHVILLTDGYASDMGWIFGKSILKSYSKSGIVVSTVGLGAVDQALMQEIADKTGGQFVLVDKADQLSQGFVAATSREASRDLVSPRNISEKNGLYLFLRILFLTLIGAAVAFIKSLACADSMATPTVLAVGSGAALVAALVMEFGLGLGLPTFLCRLVYWLALAVTPRMLVVRTTYSTGNQKIFTSDGYGFGNSSGPQW